MNNESPQQEVPAINYTLIHESPQQEIPAVNTTLTQESPTASECSQKANTTFTGDKTQDIIQSPSSLAKNKTGDDITSNKFPETVSEYPGSSKKVDTFDKITAAIDQATEIQNVEAIAPISPIYPPTVEEPSSEYVSANFSQNNHENNITPSATLENSKEIASSVDAVEIESNVVETIVSEEKATVENVEKIVEQLENVESIKHESEIVESAMLEVNEQLEVVERDIKDPETDEIITKEPEIIEPTLPDSQNNLSIPQQPESPKEITSSMPEQSETPLVPEIPQDPVVFEIPQDPVVLEVPHEDPVSFKNLDEFNTEMRVSSETPQFNTTVPINKEDEANMSMPTPMDVDETFTEDFVNAEEEPENIKEVEIQQEAPQEILEKPTEKPIEKPQQVFECDFVSQNVQELQFDFKTPQLTQQGELDKTLDMESPPDAELHQSPDEFKVPSMPKRLSVEKFESATSCESIAFIFMSTAKFKLTQVNT